MPKIIAIESGLPMDSTFYKVGKEAEYKSGKIVTEIKDLSNEWPDGIDRQYDIYVNGKLYASWINTPARIFYETEDGE